MIELRIDDLAANGGIINFSDSLHLRVCRTKAKDVWKYLKIRKETNANLPHLQQISIPPENEWKSRNSNRRVGSEFDTTRVRLCFHVSLDTMRHWRAASFILNLWYKITHSYSSFHFIQVFLHSPPHNSKVLEPVWSDLIVDTQAHHSLQIKDIFPDTTTDAGIKAP